MLFEFKEYTQSNWLVGTLCIDVNHAILSYQIILDYVILYYYHIAKSGSKHLHLEYFRMCNLVQGDVKRQNKYIYICLTKLKKNNGSLKIMGTTQNFFFNIMYVFI